MSLKKKILRKVHPITLSRGLKLVVNYKMQRGRRPRYYDKPVRELIELIGDLPIYDVTPEHIQLWHDHLSTRRHENADKSLSAWTVNYYARVLRNYFRALVAMGHLEVAPTRRLRLPKLPPKRKKEVAEPDIEKLVKASRWDLRNHAIILILRDSGCRVGELCSMRPDRIVIKEKDGRLRGKAEVWGQKMDKVRVIFFGDAACRALRAYLEARPVDADPAVLWLSYNGQAPLSPSGVYVMLKKLGKRAGVGYVTAHGFRHALAKRLVNRGAPARVIQEVLGHEDVTTTLRMYITFDEDELQEQHAEFMRDDWDSDEPAGWY